MEKLGLLPPVAVAAEDLVRTLTRELTLKVKNISMPQSVRVAPPTR